MKNSPLIPNDRAELAIMLRCFLIHKAVAELGSQLGHRPIVYDLALRGLERFLVECRA